MAAFVSSRRRQPSYCSFSAKVRSEGSITRGSHGRPDLAHGLPDSIEKGAARVFHQMPTVGDLDRVRKRSLRRDRIAASTIPGDDTDLRLLRQPGLSSGRLPIGQESDRRAPFKVADQRAVAVIAPPGPVIDADNRGRRKASWPTSAHHAQQRVIAHLDVDPARKRGCRPASERNGETVDHVVEPARASGSWLDRLEPFREDPPRAGLGVAEAGLGVAEEAAGPQNQPYPDAGGRKIRQPPPIAGCARGCKRLRASGIGKQSPRLLSRSRNRRRLSPRSQRQIRSEQAPKPQILASL